MPDEFQRVTGGRCPFCSGTFDAGYSGDKQGTVMHSMPPCERFVTLTPDRYLHAVRTANEGSA